MNVEFVEALNELCKTRRIKKEVLLEAIEQALMSAYKKNFDSASNARVTLDAITGEVAVYAQKKVVEQVENPQLEIAADNPADRGRSPPATSGASRPRRPSRSSSSASARRSAA